MPKCEQGDEHWCIQHTDVTVPEAKYDRGWIDIFVQRVKGLLAPTTSRAFTEKGVYFTEEFKGQIQEYTRVRHKIKQIFLVSRSYRLFQLTKIVKSFDLPEAPAQWDQELDTGMEHLPQMSVRNYQVIDAVPDGEHPQRTLSEDQIKLLDQYCTSITRTCTLRSHLQDVDEDLEHYTRTINTQATAECTYFRGFRDWCQIMYQLTNGLSTALIAVSTLGSGLVYSTIFSATRGDIGLMCYCFPFFSCGFLLPAIMQVLLQWGASLQKEAKFASQTFWTIVIGVSMTMSSLSVIASLTILNVTVLLLKTEPGDTVANDTPSKLVPGIIGFSITGSIFFLLFTGLLLGAIAIKAFTTLNGVRAIVSAVYGGESGHADALKVWLPV